MPDVHAPGCPDRLAVDGVRLVGSGHPEEGEPMVIPPPMAWVLQRGAAPNAVRSMSGFSDKNDLKTGFHHHYCERLAWQLSTSPD